MAAREKELEPLIGDRRLVQPTALRIHVDTHEQRGSRGERAVAADAVDRAVAGGRHQPGARVGGRRPVAGPALGGSGEDAAPLLAEDLLQAGGYHSTMGRTSIAPPRRAAGIRAA